MYVYHDGKKLEHYDLHLKTISLYRKNQSMHIERMKAQREHENRFFGMFGLGTWIIVVTLHWTLRSINPVDFLIVIQSFAFCVYGGIFIWKTVQSIIFTAREVQGHFSSYLPKVSENGLPLDDLPYDPYGEQSDAAVEEFNKKYYDLVLDSSQPLDIEPLEKPVIVDGQEVVAAYASVDLSQSSALVGTDYRIQLADGTGVQVDAENFARITSTIYKTADGEEFIVPVLTGRNASLRWGALGDALAAGRLLDGIPHDSKNHKYIIHLLDEAIYYQERALHTLRVERAPLAPELPTTSPLEAYVASIEDAQVKETQD